MALDTASRSLRRAHEVMDQVDRLSTLSEDESGLTRRYGTSALRATQDQVAAWMAAAGTQPRRDPLGNLLGRYEGATPDAPALILGSHLDSVRDAGKYDGPLGVLVALAAIKQLHERGERLPFAIELAAFADEEGTRFHTDYLGSRSYLGTLRPADLDRLDHDGVSLREAISGFGGDPLACTSARSCPENTLGYVEVHIEQGPALEAAGLPVGVVSAIAGQTKYLIDIEGVAGHAGTVAMRLRRDALAAAAELILAAEAIARETPDLVATVGEIYVRPGASNVIPNHAHLSLDIRHPDDAALATVLPELRRRVDALHQARGVTSTWTVVMQNPARPADPALTGLLEAAVTELGYPATRLPSGAGHDGVAMSTVMPFAMLFVRCAGGISHNPAESVTTEDVADAISVIDRLLTLRAEAFAAASDA
jgi:allantoate deiminase